MRPGRSSRTVTGQVSYEACSRSAHPSFLADPHLLGVLSNGSAGGDRLLCPSKLLLCHHSCIITPGCVIHLVAAGVISAYINTFFLGEQRRVRASAHDTQQAALGRASFNRAPLAFLTEIYLHSRVAIAVVRSDSRSKTQAFPPVSYLLL